ncbi:MFS transporter [Pseudomonas sp. HR96]|uniref:MFS transporter n=1 Tax=Pseudomonas sp. HR96 TaxID=1027966 RepID=UPI002A76374E|nr:MFS transporter [Pseudomonas sp. HR96]WPO97565.1 MFS transporter [Pseudomonas sp. HR96]
MIIGCALFMELLDGSAVLTALPQMASDFGEPGVRMNLVVSLYLLAVAMFVPVSGWVADRFGPRRVFIGAIALFTLASVACAAAGSLAQLSVARVVQGASGALMVPVGQVILLRWVARENLMRAMSFLTVAGLLGSVLGPPLGGLLVTLLSWHWIFLVNVPIGLLGIHLVLRHIADYPAERGQPLDGLGVVLSALAVGCLVFGFEAMGHGLLPQRWVLMLLAVGIVSALIYRLHARRHSQPLIDFSLLRISSFAVTFWGGNLFRFGSSAQSFLLVLLFQLCFGLNALQAGLLTFATGVGACLMKLLAVRIVRRVGFRRSLMVNAVLSGVLLAACAGFSVATPLWIVVPVLFASGMINSLQFSTLGSLTYADVPPQLSSRASSLSSMSVLLTISVSVGAAAALLGVMVQWRGQAQVDQQDIAAVMLLFGLVTALSALLFRGLAPEAGAHIYRGR